MSVCLPVCQSVSQSSRSRTQVIDLCWRVCLFLSLPADATVLWNSTSLFAHRGDHVCCCISIQSALVLGSCQAEQLIGSHITGLPAGERLRGCAGCPITCVFACFSSSEMMPRYVWTRSSNQKGGFGCGESRGLWLSNVFSVSVSWRQMAAHSEPASAGGLFPSTVCWCCSGSFTWIHTSKSRHKLNRQPHHDAFDGCVRGFLRSSAAFPAPSLVMQQVAAWLFHWASGDSATLSRLKFPLINLRLINY